MVDQSRQKNALRFSMRELLFAATAVSGIAGGFAAFGLLGSAAIGVLVGSCMIVAGRRTRREWLYRSGEALAAVAAATVVAVLAADHPSFIGVLYRPLQAVVGNPNRIVFVAFGFAGLGLYLSLMLRRVAWPPFAVAAAWLAYAEWEQYCASQRWNIRIDLLLVAPVLAVLTIWGTVAPLLQLWQVWRNMRRQSAPTLRSWQETEHNDVDDHK